MIEGPVYFVVNDSSIQSKPLSFKMGGKGLCLRPLLISFLLQNDRSQHFTDEVRDIHVATFIID